MSKSLDGVLTKKAHKTEKFSEQHIIDLQSCSDPDNGYLYFSRYFFHIQHSVKGKLLFEPFDYQVNLLNCYHAHRFNINMLPRQSGKCLKGDTTVINIRNNQTGKEYEISIKDFYDMQSNNSRSK